MPKQTTVRLPEDLADQAEAVARAQGISLNQLIIGALHLEIDRVKSDGDFQTRVKRLVERDQKILDRLAE
ncbi:MAG: toxin-antitoxin system HicB family antitoxin [Actinomycetota bacterium]